MYRSVSVRLRLHSKWSGFATYVHFGVWPPTSWVFLGGSHQISDIEIPLQVNVKFYTVVLFLSKPVLLIFLLISAAGHWTKYVLVLNNSCLTNLFPALWRPAPPRIHPGLRGLRGLRGPPAQVSPPPPRRIRSPSGEEAPAPRLQPDQEAAADPQDHRDKLPAGRARLHHRSAALHRQESGVNSLFVTVLSRLESKGRKLPDCT